MCVSLKQCNILGQRYVDRAAKGLTYAGAIGSIILVYTSTWQALLSASTLTSAATAIGLAALPLAIGVIGAHVLKRNAIAITEFALRYLLSKERFDQIYQPSKALNLQKAFSQPQDRVLTAVSAALYNGANPNFHDATIQAPALHALLSMQLDPEHCLKVINVLVQYGADLNLAHREQTPLELVLTNLNTTELPESKRPAIYQTAETLLQLGTNPRERTLRNAIQVPVHTQECVDFVDQLLQKGATPNFDTVDAVASLDNPNEHTLALATKLIEAIKQADESLHEGKVINTLTQAMKRSNQDIAHLIIDAFPDVVKETDQEGKTPLLLACKHIVKEDHLVDIIQRLMGADASLNHQDDEGKTALHYLVSRTPSPITAIQYLLGRQARTDLKTTGLLSLEETPLALAARLSCAEAVQILAQHNPQSLTETDNLGQTPLDSAIYNQKCEAATVLLDLRAPTQALPKDLVHKMVSHISSWGPVGEEEKPIISMLALLAKHQIPLNNLNLQGQTPLAYLYDQGQHSVHHIKHKIAQKLLDYTNGEDNTALLAVAKSPRVEDVFIAKQISVRSPKANLKGALAKAKEAKNTEMQKMLENALSTQ